MRTCIMKIKCPQCQKEAHLSGDFSYVECQQCGLDMTYGEYVKFLAHNDKTYSDILGDYASDTKGQSAGTLDEWD